MAHRLHFRSSFKDFSPLKSRIRSPILDGRSDVKNSNEDSGVKILLLYFFLKTYFGMDAFVKLLKFLTNLAPVVCIFKSFTLYLKTNLKTCQNNVTKIDKNKHIK